MTDLLPGFRTQLQRRAAELDRAEPLAEHGRRRRRWRRPHGRGLAVVVLVAGASAGGLAYAAATTLWQPQLSTAGREGATATASPIPADQLRALGVLRRPQTDLDRNVGSRYALQLSSGKGERVRTNGVRRLATGTGGGVIVLVPYEARFAMFWEGARPPKHPPQRLVRDELCLNYVGPWAGGGVTCGSLDDVLSGKLGVGMGESECLTAQQRRGFEESQAREDRWARLEGRPAVRLPCKRDRQAILGTYWVGVVPDGVARVQVGRHRGAPTVPVHDNLFQSDRGSGFTRDHVWLDAAGQPISRKRADLRARLGLPPEPPRTSPRG